ncbi:hypothetical protein CY34DRAFT_800663 [Suillus luteus UH-Slu-Lm8-n1]|uniref:Uncharacterized protein n=1 Tax=Suillus luteus UH-Slu-Lm8-n1 TaxID=930992 RepID=A0A0D0A7T0_9AGAM|nr:hypothetical protein CY34DRAFT_800663 [Suillus luteus UH-Slu-Lm8-n1]
MDPQASGSIHAYGQRIVRMRRRGKDSGVERKLNCANEIMLMVCSGKENHRLPRHCSLDFGSSPIST